MSAGCQHQHHTVFDGTSPQYRRALWIVIAINAAMFVIELSGGALAGSRALQADALDFLGDSLTYGLSLAVIGMPLARRAAAAVFKGVTLLVMGVWVLATTMYQVLILGVPDVQVMTLIGVLALLANVTSVLMLMGYKDGDANVRSVWLCSRNDAIGNAAVMGAAGVVAWSQSGWPDLIVAALMATLFLSSARSILRAALAERRQARAVL